MAYGYSGGSLGGGRLDGGGSASRNDPRDRQSGASRTARSPKTVKQASRKPFKQVDVNQQRHDGRLGVRQANRSRSKRGALPGASSVLEGIFSGGPLAGGRIGAPRAAPAINPEEDEGFFGGVPETVGRALEIINPPFAAALDETRPTDQRVGAAIATGIGQVASLAPPIALVRGLGSLFNWLGAKPLYADGTVRNPQTYALDSGPGGTRAPRPARPNEQEFAPTAVAATPAQTARGGARGVFNLTTARISRPLFFGIGR